MTGKLLNERCGKGFFDSGKRGAYEKLDGSILDKTGEVMNPHRRVKNPCIWFDEICFFYIPALFQKFKYMVGKADPDDDEEGHYDTLAFGPHPGLMPGVYFAVKKMIQPISGVSFHCPIARFSSYQFERGIRACSP